VRGRKGEREKGRRGERRKAKGESPPERLTRPNEFVRAGLVQSGGEKVESRKKKRPARPARPARLPSSFNSMKIYYLLWGI